jgi:hypothetical protein
MVLAFMEIALCMDIWVDSDFGSQVRIGKKRQMSAVQWFRHKCIPST